MARPENKASQNVIKKIGMSYVRNAIFNSTEFAYFEINRPKT